MLMPKEIRYSLYRRHELTHFMSKLRMEVHILDKTQTMFKPVYISSFMSKVRHVLYKNS